MPWIEPHTLPVPCDLSLWSISAAVTQLVNEWQEQPTCLTVHPYSKHLASMLIDQAGWRGLKVYIDPTLDEHDWCLLGTVNEIRSELKGDAS